MKDPGSFTIPCIVGKYPFEKALCDLGASINLMPLSIFQKLGLGEVKPTTTILKLVAHLSLGDHTRYVSEGGQIYLSGRFCGARHGRRLRDPLDTWKTILSNQWSLDQCAKRRVDISSE